MRNTLALIGVLVTVVPAYAAPKKSPDIVAVRGASPAEMFASGIEALGGMRSFVKKGQTVLVKPNIGWNKTPAQGATTNPELVGAIIKSAYAAGAKEVWVFDHTCDEEKAAYKNSGIQDAVEKAGGKMYSGADEKDYVEVSIPKAKILKTAKVHRLYKNADVVINVPILKHHMGSGMSAGLKNLMGVVWDRRYWHREGLQQCIADFGLMRKIKLTIIDAYTVMMEHGPRGISPNDLKTMKMQIISSDIVLADTASAKTMDISPATIPHIALAEQLGIGSTKLEKAEIRRITVGVGVKKEN